MSLSCLFSEILCPLGWWLGGGGGGVVGMLAWESLNSSQAAHQEGAYPSFCIMRPAVFLLLPLWMLVHRKVTPTCSIKFAGTFRTLGDRFSKKPGNFSGPLSHTKISNLTITELFYSHTILKFQAHTILRF